MTTTSLLLRHCISPKMITVHLQCVQRTSWRAACQGVQCSRMPYPSKTDRQTILSAAVKELAHGGIRDLSLRNIAASLDLAPNAIYRYFSDRRALEAALADEAARQLELALRKAADGCEPVTAIRKMSSAYIKFARDNPHLYEAMMSLHAPEHDATSHLSLWAFTVEQVQRIAGSDRARAGIRRALGILTWSRRARSRSSVRRDQTGKRARIWV